MSGTAQNRLTLKVEDWTKILLLGRLIFMFWITWKVGDLYFCSMKITCSFILPHFNIYMHYWFIRYEKPFVMLMEIHYYLYNGKLTYPPLSHATSPATVHVNSNCTSIVFWGTQAIRFPSNGQEASSTSHPHHRVLFTHKQYHMNSTRCDQ
jgi:hypothetical protein